MIRTHDTTPQQALAHTLGGTILGPDAIEVDGHLLVASVRGVVRVDGRQIGMWHDGTDDLAARYRALVAGQRMDFGPVVS